jgi:hypothetical protein
MTAVSESPIHKCRRSQRNRVTHLEVNQHSRCVAIVTHNRGIGPGVNVSITIFGSVSTYGIKICRFFLKDNFFGNLGQNIFANFLGKIYEQNHNIDPVLKNGACLPAATWLRRASWRRRPCSRRRRRCCRGCGRLETCADRRPGVNFWPKLSRFASKTFFTPYANKLALQIP